MNDDKPCPLCGAADHKKYQVFEVTYVACPSVPVGSAVLFTGPGSWVPIIHIGNADGETKTWGTLKERVQVK